MSSVVLAYFKELEESLWIAATRFDPVYMERVLHPEFFEFGCSGRVYSRAQIMATTGQPMRTIAVKLPFENFTIHHLTPDVIHITYMSEVQYEALQICNRASIWVRVDGVWLLKFHQGTATTR